MGEVQLVPIVMEQGEKTVTDAVEKVHGFAVTVKARKKSKKPVSIVMVPVNNKQ